MIRKITFNKEYSVEPWFGTTNPKAVTEKYKLTRFDRGYSTGKLWGEHTYIPLFHKNLVIDFHEKLNVIIGSNGCGKSQLIKILKSKLKKEHHEYDLQHIVMDFYEKASFDVDFPNGAIKNVIKPNPNSNGFLAETVMVMDSSDKSHGENTKMLMEMFNGKKDMILFLDEPEMGLDLKSQYKLCHDILELAKHNQIFVVTHSKILMESVDYVYNMDKFQWNTPQEVFDDLNFVKPSVKIEKSNPAWRESLLMRESSLKWWDSITQDEKTRLFRKYYKGKLDFVIINGRKIEDIWKQEIIEEDNNNIFVK